MPGDEKSLDRLGYYWHQGHALMCRQHPLGLSHRRSPGMSLFLGAGADHFPKEVGDPLTDTRRRGARESTSVDGVEGPGVSIHLRGAP